MIKDRQLQGKASSRVTMDPTGGADNSLSCASDFRMDYAPLKKKLSLEPQLQGSVGMDYPSWIQSSCPCSTLVESSSIGPTICIM